MPVLMFGITEIQAEMAAEKRRKDKKDREASDGEPLTAAHAIAEGEAAEAAREARKAVADIGCTDPGAGVMPPAGMPDADAYDRPYLESGTAAPGPGYQAPNVAPLPPQHPGILQPLPQSAEPVIAGPGIDGPIVATMKQHQARANATMPSMPVPGGAA
jgi:hypothetical protein